MVEPAFVTSHNVFGRKSLPSASCRWSNCDYITIGVPFVLVPQHSGNPIITDFLVHQSLYHLLHGTMSNDKLYYIFCNQHTLVFCFECIKFLYIAFHDGGSWSIIVRHSGNVLAAISELFHRTLHNAGTHAGISTDITKTIKDVWRRNALLCEGITHSMLAKWYIIYHSGLWISADGHVLDLYLRLQKTDTTISCTTPSLVKMINHI
jgi:hypothetical protein